VEAVEEEGSCNLQYQQSQTRWSRSRSSSSSSSSSSRRSEGGTRIAVWRFITAILGGRCWRENTSAKW
jgi:hypothetical protein